MLQMVYAALGSAKGAYDFWANGEVGEKVGFIKDLLQSSNDPDAQKEKLNQLKNQIENEQAAPDVKSYSDPMNPYKNKYTTSREIIKR